MYVKGSIRRQFGGHTDQAPSLKSQKSSRLVVAFGKYAASVSPVVWKPLFWSVYSRTLLLTYRAGAATLSSTALREATLKEKKKKEKSKDSRVASSPRLDVLTPTNIDKDKGHLFPLRFLQHLARHCCGNTGATEKKTMAGFFWPEDAYGKWQGCLAW